MNFTLSPKYEQLVRRKVDAGQFESTSEVVEEALRQMEEREKLERLKAAIDVGHQQYLRGEVRELTPELIEEMNREADRMIKEGEEPDPDVCP